MILKPLLFAVTILILVFSCKPASKISTSHEPQILSVDTVKLADSLKISEQEEVSELIDSVLKDTLQELNESIQLKDTFSFIGVGDIMTGTNFPSPKYLPLNNAKSLWEHVKDTLKSADFTFGNLEGVILNKGGERKYCKDTTICYLFRMPEVLSTNFVEAGFDMFSTANNHAGDFGNSGRKNTMKVLDSLGINHAGLLLQPYTSFERDGLKIGFAAFSPNTGTASINDYKIAQRTVSMLDSLNDIVVVSFHGGAEGSKYEHVTRKRETFYGENRGNVYEFAHLMIDSGADIIFGHGPHVTRSIELYNDRFISYSLGNFCTYGRFNLRGVNGIAPIIKVFTDSEGNFISGQIIPITQKGAGIPIIDTSKKVIYKMQELLSEDFPDATIEISDSGEITKITE